MKKAEAVTENVKVELLPSAESILRPGVDNAILDRLVQEKVAEIMAEREVDVLEPFFRSRQIAFEIRRLQTFARAGVLARVLRAARLPLELGVGVGTIHQAAHNAASLSGSSKTQEKAFLNPSLRHSQSLALAHTQAFLAD
jgi:hypothetical protein